MEAQSLISHQLSWWFSCFSLREKLAWSHNVTACIHKHVKANPEELMKAMNGKLSLEDWFLLDKSLEEYQLYQNLMNKLTSEIIAYIEKEFPWRK